MKISTAFIVCISLFFLSNELTAQSKEYIKGYMVTLENDTIGGYIKDDKREVLAYQFSFKKTMDGRAQTITPPEAKGFYFAPSFYFENKKKVQNKIL